MMDRYERSRNISNLQREQGEWAAVVFGDQTSDEKLKHLLKEVQEVRDDPNDVMEYADCLMLLIDAARMNHISAEMIMLAAWTKLEINRKRDWTRNEDGTYSGSKDND